MAGVSQTIFVSLTRRLKINPNGRIPTITDSDGFSVFETSAILVYLAQKYDKDLKFSHDPKADPKGYSEELQWLFFAVRFFSLGVSFICDTNLVHSTAALDPCRDKPTISTCTPRRLDTICESLIDLCIKHKLIIETSVISRPYAKERYLNETKRLYGVLEIQLKDRPYLLGSTYGIADIKAFGWCVFTISIRSHIVLTVR